MSDTRHDEIIEKYHNLYSVCTRLECGPGWYDIIDKLSEKLEEIIKKMIDESDIDFFPPHAEQVKEKHGTLRFYMSWLTGEMIELIEEAEEESSITCEICGKTGKMIGNAFHYQTLCEQCE